jgi:hypothetical protein
MVIFKQSQTGGAGEQLTHQAVMSFQAANTPTFECPNTTTRKSQVTDVESRSKIGHLTIQHVSRQYQSLSLSTCYLHTHHV